MPILLDAELSTRSSDPRGAAPWVDVDVSIVTPTDWSLLDLQAGGSLAPVIDKPGVVELLAKAKGMSPEEFASEVRNFEFSGEPGDDVAKRQRALRLLRFFNGTHGTIGLSGLLPPLEGAMLKARLASIVDTHWRAEHPERAETLGGHGGDRYEQRMADALLEATGIIEPEPAVRTEPEPIVGTEPAEPGVADGRSERRNPTDGTEPEEPVEPIHPPSSDTKEAAPTLNNTEPAGAPHDSDTAVESDAAGESDTATKPIALVAPPTVRAPPVRIPPIPSKPPNPSVVIVFDVDKWQAELLGHGPIPVTGTLFDMAKADLYYSFTNMHGEILKFGLARRDPTALQRLAVIARDRHCVYPGCNAPPSHCDVHHTDEVVRDGGPTDVDKLALVCRPEHHPHIHHKGLKIERERNGTTSIRDRLIGEQVVQSPDGDPP